ncbi:unnamed protein product [Heligmosomoides polygyrus]|uniref:G_PROTEIN_RECEP_F1_2 domain-containing protein n=1 Tax=Heligmosomoides polygyrus TaxID=6339 RepID=A0A183FZX4_HELPZ|nr:unnamed protein product [Heligmosomoides polygyrus]
MRQRRRIKPRPPSHETTPLATALLAACHQRRRGNARPQTREAEPCARKIIKETNPTMDGIFQLTHLRRQRAIRRCLFMATVQVILNAPYYTLQLIDEVYSLHNAVLYLCPLIIIRKYSLATQTQTLCREEERVKKISNSAEHQSIFFKKTIFKNTHQQIGQW